MHWNSTGKVWVSKGFLFLFVLEKYWINLELRNKCYFYDPCETVASWLKTSCVVCVWVPHRMLRVCVLLGAFLSPASSWWFTNNTKPEDPGPWHVWLQDHSPSLHEYVLAAENGFDRFAQEHYVEMPRFDAGLWLVIDTLVGLVGWAIFGTAWNEVRLGCRRVFQFTALLGVCLAAHYIWAVCYPVVSIVIAAVMTIVWCLRKILKVMGTVGFYLQRWTGGAPEAAGLIFVGPGTGKIPETTDLRQLKRTGDAEKWIAVRRGDEVAVFSVGSDAQSIRSHGLYLPVESDSVRGHTTLVQLLKNVDKVHLCRNMVCPEECSAHFQQYAVVKQFNPETFQLAQAEEGARETGRLLWGWLRGTTTSAQKLARRVLSRKPRHRGPVKHTGRAGPPSKDWSDFLKPFARRAPKSVGSC